MVGLPLVTMYKMGHCSIDAFPSNFQSYRTEAYHLMTQTLACRKASIRAEIVIYSSLRGFGSISLNKTQLVTSLAIQKVSLQMLSKQLICLYASLLNLKTKIIFQYTHEHYIFLFAAQ